jgi:hypothetical protein
MEMARSEAVAGELAVTGMLKPLGNPQPKIVKFFAALEVLEQVKDRAWLAKVTNAVDWHWQKKNAAKKVRSLCYKEFAAKSVNRFY